MAANATRLDRANKSVLQEGVGAPTANTRGNVYLDRSTGTFYVKSITGWVVCGDKFWETYSTGFRNKEDDVFIYSHTLATDLARFKGDGTVSIGAFNGKNLTLVSDEADLIGAAGEDIKFYYNTEGSSDNAFQIWNEALPGTRILSINGNGTVSWTPMDGFNIDNSGESNGFLDFEIGTSVTIAYDQMTTGNAFDIKWRSLTLARFDSDGNFHINPGGTAVNDFRASSNNVWDMLRVYSAYDMVGIDAPSAWMTGGPAQAPLNVSDHTFLLGDTIYDLDFTSGSSLTTAARVRGIGIKMIPSGLLAGENYLGGYRINCSGSGGSGAYNIDTQPQYATWSYDSSAPDDGWKVTGLVGASDESGVLVFPLVRQGNWECFIDFYMPTVSAGEETIVVLGAMSVGGAVAFWTGTQFNSTGNIYEPRLGVNTGDDTFVDSNVGTTSTLPNTFRMGLKFENGTLSRWDSVAGSWAGTTAIFGYDGSNHWSYALDHIFMMFAHESTLTFVSPSLQGLEFNYLP